MTVSVVIPTLNGGERFKQLLSALKRQKTVHDMELIVIDSDSTDGTVEAARDAGAKLIQIDGAEFNHGRTRNKAIAQSSGEYILLLTQDAVPVGASFIETLADCLDNDALLAGATARQIPVEGQRVFTKMKHSRKETAGETALTFDRQTKGFPLFDSVAAMARAAVLKYIPLPELDFAEDRAWAKEAVGAGLRLRYEPQAVVEHSHDRSLFYSYARGYVEGRFWQSQGESRYEEETSKSLVRAGVQSAYDLVALLENTPDLKSGFMEAAFAAAHNVAEQLGGQLGQAEEKASRPNRFKGKV